MGYIEELLAANEKIVLRTRRHWGVLAGSFVVNLFLSIGILILSVLVGLLATPLGLGAVGLLVWVLLLIPLVNFGRNFLDWWNEEYLVTNRRVIQSEGVINKHVIDSSLEKVNDVVMNQTFLGRVFDFGDIEILTASEIGINKLGMIASPVKFKTEMINQKEALGMDERVSGGTRPPRDVPELIADLDELRKQGVLTEAEFQEKKAQLLAKM